MSSTAGGHDVFLSYSTADRPHVLKVQEFLSQRGVKTFLDAQSLDTGMPWFDGLQKAIDSAHAVAIFVGRHGLGNWQQHEVAIAIDRQAKEKRTGRKLPVVPVLLPGVDPEDAPSFVRVNVWIRLTDTAADALALERLLTAVQNHPTLPTPASPPTLCPYRGLKAFREEDADLFFGRDAFSEQLLEHALVRPLVAAVGASGSGKSSVLQAGLLPRLRRQRPPESTWSAVVFTPGKAPFHNLAAALYTTWKVEEKTGVDLALEAEKLGKGLADGGRFELAIRPALESLQTDKLLIVVDQFEELFTQTPEAECGRFIESLLAAMDSARVILALTLRADFYGRALASSRALSDLLQRGQVNLGPMQPQELREIIERPAMAAGLSFEPGLVDRILGDVEEQPGALPLLEFALTELWQGRVDTLLTNKAYDAMGKVEGAIAQRAQTAFLKVPKEQQPAALRGLTRLVRVSAADEEGSDTRQRAPLDTLDGPTRLAVAEMTAARLLVMGGAMLGRGTKYEEQPADAGTPGEAAQVAAPDELAESSEVVEIAHEALIRNWPTLKNRLDEDRQFLLWRQRLRQRMGEWQQAGQDRGALLAGTLLAQARRWERSRPEDLNDAEKEFIHASELAERQPRRWRAVAAAILLVLTAVGAGVWGLTRTDWYQVRQIVADISKNPAQIYASDPETVGNWVTALVFLGHTDEAIAAASKVEEGGQSKVFASAISALNEIGRYGEALTAMSKISVENEATAFAAIANASLAAGKLQEIELAAAKIRDDYVRSRTYSAIAQALLNSGKAKEAEGYAVMAKTAAQKVDKKVAIGRSLALSGAADVLVLAGLLREAKDAVLEAKAMAEKIREPEARSKALVAAAETMIKIGDIKTAMEVTASDVSFVDRNMLFTQAATALMKQGMALQAFAVSSKIAYIDTKTTHDAPGIASTLIKSGRLQEVEKVASNLKDANEQSRALAAIGLALMLDGRPRLALVVIGRIESWPQRLDIVTSILQGLISRGKVPQAEFIDEVKSWVTEVPSPHRAQALAQISELLTSVGRLPEAREIAAQAQAALSDIPESSDKYRTRRRVAYALIKAGELEKATNTLPFRSDLSSEFDFRQSQLFALIAEEWSKRGMLDQTLAAAENALFANELEVGMFDNSDIYNRIAEAIIRVSDRPSRSLGEILDRARFFQRSEAFAALAEALIEVGKPTEALIVAGEITSSSNAIDITLAALAKLTPEQVLAAIDKFPDPSIRSEAFSRIAWALADAKKTDEAEAAVEKASKAAGFIRDGIKRSMAFKGIAVAWAYLGHLRLAREEAENCGMPNDKVDAYATILLRYSEKRGFKASASRLKKRAEVDSSSGGGSSTDRLLSFGAETASGQVLASLGPARGLRPPHPQPRRVYEDLLSVAKHSFWASTYALFDVRKRWRASPSRRERPR